MTTTKKAAGKRPAAITVICVIGFLGLAATAWLYVSGAMDGAPDWYPPYLAGTAAVGLVSMIGMFLMRAWGFWLYAAMFIVNQIIMVSTGIWSPMAAVIPLVVVVVAFFSLDKMR